MVTLKREKIHLNRKLLRRLYREEGFQVRKRGGRKRVLGTRAPILLPARPGVGNDGLWILSATVSPTACRFRILCIVDDFSRECLALVADTSLSGHRLARELSLQICKHGKPSTIVSDNGTEMKSNAIL